MSEETPVVDGSAYQTSESSVESTVSMMSGTPAETTTAQDWGSLIPEDLRGKESFKNILKSENPAAEMAKQLDNAQTLIGKKTPGVPAADAPDEEWTKFYEAARPESADEYEIPEIDLGEDKKELAAAVNKMRDSDYSKGMKQAFHEFGLTPRQAAGISIASQKLAATQYEGDVASAKVRDEHFEDLARKTFAGDREKAEKFGREFMATNSSERTKAIIAGWENKDTVSTNEALMVMSDLGMQVHKKYEKGDTFNAASSDSQMSLLEAEAEMHKEQAKPGYYNTFAGDHKAVRERVSDLSKTIARLKY